MYRVLVKSGTGGHYDRDGCALVVGIVESNIIPQIGATLLLGGANNQNHRSYLVREVQHFINQATDERPEEEWITVFVIPV